MKKMFMLLLCVFALPCIMFAGGGPEYCPPDCYVKFTRKGCDDFFVLMHYWATMHGGYITSYDENTFGNLRHGEPIATNTCELKVRGLDFFEHAEEEEELTITYRGLPGENLTPAEYRLNYYKDQSWSGYQKESVHVDINWVDYGVPNSALDLYYDYAKRDEIINDEKEAEKERAVKIFSDEIPNILKSKVFTNESVYQMYKYFIEHDPDFLYAFNSGTYYYGSELVELGYTDVKTTDLLSKVMGDYIGTPLYKKSNSGLTCKKNVFEMELTSVEESGISDRPYKITGVTGKNKVQVIVYTDKEAVTKYSKSQKWSLPFEDKKYGLRVINYNKHGDFQIEVETYLRASEYKR